MKVKCGLRENITNSELRRILVVWSADWCLLQIHRKETYNFSPLHHLLRLISVIGLIVLECVASRRKEQIMIMIIFSRGPRFSFPLSMDDTLTFKPGCRLISTDYWPDGILHSFKYIPMFKINRYRQRWNTYFLMSRECLWYCLDWHRLEAIYLRISFSARNVGGFSVLLSLIIKSITYILS